MPKIKMPYLDQADMAVPATVVESQSGDRLRPLGKEEMSAMSALPTLDIDTPRRLATRTGRKAGASSWERTLPESVGDVLAYGDVVCFSCTSGGREGVLCAGGYVDQRLGVDWEANDFSDSRFVVEASTYKVRCRQLLLFCSCCWFYCWYHCCTRITPH